MLTEARRTTRKPLPTQGYYFDQGMRPTHKDEIIALYETGLDEAVIPHQTQHAPTSMGQYIRDYDQVKPLLTQRTPVEHIPQLIGMQPHLARAYLELVYKYHPDLRPQDEFSQRP